METYEDLLKRLLVDGKKLNFIEDCKMLFFAINAIWIFIRQEREVKKTPFSETHLQNCFKFYNTVFNEWLTEKKQNGYDSKSIEDSFVRKFVAKLPDFWWSGNSLSEYCENLSDKEFISFLSKQKTVLRGYVKECWNLGKNVVSLSKPL